MIKFINAIANGDSKELIHIKYKTGRIILSFILSVVFFVISGHEIFAQNRFCFKLKDRPMIEALSRLRTQGGYDFTYNGNPSDLRVLITTSINTNSIVNALNKILRNSNITFYINEKQIILYNMAEEKAGSSSMGSGNQAYNSTIKGLLNKKIVSGRVTDERGRWLKGAYIRILGRTKGVTTDVDGSFILDTDECDSLEISYSGMKNKKLAVQGKKYLGIVLKNNIDSTFISNTFNRHKNDVITSSLNNFEEDYLSLMPNLHSKTSFVSSLPGISVLSNSGEPGANDEFIFIRGAGSLNREAICPLIIIDGIEQDSRELLNMNAGDIARIEILKNISSTALYASKGANGVVRVTTKNGRNGRAKVSVTTETSVSSSIKDLKLCSSVDFMVYRNLAAEFDSKRTNSTPNYPYSKAYIDKFRDKIDPSLYPIENWRQRLFNSNSWNRNSRIDISGGNSKLNYFASLSHNKENGILTTNKSNIFNPNIRLDKYACRVNLGFNIDSKRQLTLRINGSVSDYKGPANGRTKYGRNVYGGMWLSSSSIYNYSLQADPIAFPAYFQPNEDNPNPGHIMFGNTGDGDYLNPYAELMKGIKTYKHTKFNIALTYSEKLDNILKGLLLSGNISASRELYYDKTKSYKPTFYCKSTSEKDKYVEILPGSSKIDYKEGRKDITDNLYISTGLSYSKSLNKKHCLKALAQASLKESKMPNSGSRAESTPLRNISLFSSFSYSYDNRYSAQVSLSQEGTSRFDKAHRWKTFPSINFCWIGSKENFWKSVGLDRWLTDFKINTGLGVSGDEYISYYRFYDIESLNTDDNYNISYNSYKTGKVGREIAHRFEIGFETTILKKLTIGLDLFKENRSNVLQYRDNLPFESGITGTPKASLASTKSKGLDFTWNYSHKFKNKLCLSIRGNLNYESCEYSKYDEPKYSKANSHLSYIGRKTYEEEGLIAIGLFRDMDEIENSPKQTFGNYGPGDIKYKDLNEDGVIDSRDIRGIGKPYFPELYYGFGLNLRYAQWDLSCYFQGSSKSSFFIDYDTFAPFINNINDSKNQKGHNALLTFVRDNYWSANEPEIQTKWPRLTEVKSDNNAQQSTWWMRDNSFLRLKSIEIGYTIPNKLIRRTWLNSVRFYVGGTNLLTFSNFKLWDPEMAHRPTWYPTQKTYNFGIKIYF